MCDQEYVRKQKSWSKVISVLRVRLDFLKDDFIMKITPLKTNTGTKHDRPWNMYLLSKMAFWVSTPLKFNSSPLENGLFWDGLFSGAMFNFQGVCQLSGEWPAIIQLLPWNFTPSNSSSSSALSFARECSWTPLVSTSSPRKWTAEALRQGNIGNFLQELLGTTPKNFQAGNLWVDSLKKHLQSARWFSVQLILE